MILTVQENNDRNSIELLFDKEGLNLLRNVINKNWHEPIATNCRSASRSAK